MSKFKILDDGLFIDKISKTYGNKEEKIQGYLDGKDNLELRNNHIVWYKESSKWNSWIEMFNQIEDRIKWIQNFCIFILFSDNRSNISNGF